MTDEDKLPEVELTRGVRILRRIVIIMGFVLVFGFIALIVAAYFKFQSKPEPVNYVAEKQVEQYPPPVPAVQLPNPDEILPSLETPKSNCIFKRTADLPIEGEIINYSLKDNILTIITAKTSSEKEHAGRFLTLTTQKHTTSPQQIIIFDLCRGDILSRINVITEN